MSKEIRNLGIILTTILVASFLFYKLVLTAPATNSYENATQKPAVTIPMVSNVDSQHSFSYGPRDAKVTVVEFFDPECESCAAVGPYIKNEMKYYEGKVRWVFRYMAYHHNSKTAIKVLEAARKQNKFLEVQNLLLENQKIWGERKSSTEQQILEIASQVKGLNMNQIKKDMNDPAFEDIINKDAQDGKSAGVTGTPTFFVNGVILEQLNLDMLIQRINQQL